MSPASSILYTILEPVQRRPDILPSVNVSMFRIIKVFCLCHMRSLTVNRSFGANVENSWLVGRSLPPSPPNTIVSEYILQTAVGLLFTYFYLFFTWKHGNSCTWTCESILCTQSEWKKVPLSSLECFTMPRGKLEWKDERAADRSAHSLSVIFLKNCRNLIYWGYEVFIPVVWAENTNQDL